MNIHISDCFFIRSSEYDLNGGVIYVLGDSYSMNVNFSMFYGCTCSYNGGAIYFSSSSSYLRMICAYRCSCGAPYVGHFALLSTSQKNHVEYLSVSNSSHNASGSYSIYLSSGNQRVDNINSSMNNAFQVSGICIESPSSFTSSHSTFSNNKVSDYGCISFSSSSGTISMSYANIVYNNSPTQGIICAYGGQSLKLLMYCIFQKNQNYLFSVDYGSLEVSHSFIDHSSSFSTSKAVSTESNNSFIMTQTFLIYHSGELMCKIPSQSNLIWIIFFIAYILIVSLLILLFIYRKSFVIHMNKCFNGSNNVSP